LHSISKNVILIILIERQSSIRHTYLIVIMEKIIRGVKNAGNETDQRR